MDPPVTVVATNVSIVEVVATNESIVPDGALIVFVTCIDPEVNVFVLRVSELIFDAIIFVIVPLVTFNVVPVKRGAYKLLIVPDTIPKDPPVNVVAIIVPTELFVTTNELIVPFVAIVFVTDIDPPVIVVAFTVVAITVPDEVVVLTRFVVVTFVMLAELLIIEPLILIDPPVNVLATAVPLELVITLLVFAFNVLVDTFV